MQNIFRTLKSVAFGSQRNIESLDGLRAVSIALVLLSHLSGTRNFPSVPGQEDLGPFGVRVFFVISGFLITSILLEETRKTGTINLPRFYLRRTLRLFPACYFLIGVTALLSGTSFILLNVNDLTCAWTYTMNFCTDRAWTLGHLWSLAIEEQFYLLWPFTLRALGRSKGMRLMLGVLAMAPLVRMSLPYWGEAQNLSIFFINADSLAVGCLLAGWRQELFANRTYRGILESRAFFLVPLVALAANYIPYTRVRWAVGDTTMNICLAVCVDWAMRNSRSLVGRFLNLPSVSFIGVLSYSLYLWQQFFLDRGQATLLNSFPINLLLAVVCALGSYLLIETPFMRLRGTLERRLFPRSEPTAAVAAAAALPKGE